MRTLAIAALVLALGGCGGDDEVTPQPGRGRGPLGSGSVAAAPVTTTATPSAFAHHEHDTLDRDPLDRLPPATGTSSTTTETTPGTEAAPEPRRYGDELATAIGSPAPCIDTETARTLHGHLSIAVSATVVPTGSVTRATATGSVPTSVLECVQARALGVHLAAPIEGAPRTISTTLSFDVTTTDDEVTVTTPEWHQPGQLQQPGVVLPAVGATGRPEGAVRPDLTLPAQGTGRQDGRVAPDITTPARGGGGTIWPSNP